MATTQKLTSRAVVRTVEPGSSAICVVCGTPVKFAARTQQKQVIANVYVDGRWDRVEHFHFDCYEGGDKPYGEPSQ